MSKPAGKYAPRPWKCRHFGWLLGFVVRDSHVRRLNVLRVARDWASELTRLQIHRGELAGLAYYTAMGVNSCENIPCGHCGGSNPWDMGEDALEELLAERAQRSPL